MTTDKAKNFFRVSAEDFKKIPGCPIAYEIPDRLIEDFEQFPKLEDIAFPRKGMVTADNPRFIRIWSELSLDKIGFNIPSREFAVYSKKKWFPYMKGGMFRRWYGNQDHVVNWENDGFTLMHMQQEGYKVGSTNQNLNYIFKPAITWTKISSGNIGFRANNIGYLYDDASGLCPVKDNKDFYLILGLLNAPIALFIINRINPTINLNPGNLSQLPVYVHSIKILAICEHLVDISKSDWDSYEISWDFQTNSLLAVGNSLNASGNQYDLSAVYIALRRDWQRQTEEMRRLEIENNRIFIDAYGLQDELSPEVPWNEITLTCNPWYRYGKKIENFDVVCNDFVLAKKERIEILPVNNNELNERAAESFPFAKETEERLLEDTVKELISYAVGCMMGRYSPEKPGLILANQGDDIDRYKEILIDKNTRIGQAITENTPYSESATILTAPFYPIHECCEQRIHEIADKDGVIPILDEEWFIDDIVAQFKSFLKFTFGMEHFADNLDFIEKALGKDIRKYFIKDFYKDHVQRYKKRPIYWMFSSPKGSFNALIYMHRYRPDTVSIVLNEYLREFISKIRSHREHLITENNRATLAPAEKTRNLKLIDKYAAMLTELDAYERDILYPLAQQKIAIDLDDGVKVNYCKFGAALKKIPGLEAKEE